MDYRDERDALRGRVENLEEELSEATRELATRRAALATRTAQRDVYGAHAEESPSSADDGLGARVAAPRADPLVPNALRWGLAASFVLTVVGLQSVFTVTISNVGTIAQVASSVPRLGPSVTLAAVGASLHGVIYAARLVWTALNQRRREAPPGGGEVLLTIAWGVGCAATLVRVASMMNLIRDGSNTGFRAAPGDLA